jgi:hypothetical protein
MSFQAGDHPIDEDICVPSPSNRESRFRHIDHGKMGVATQGLSVRDAVGVSWKGLANAIS